MIRRVGFAAVAIPLLILVVWLGGWPLAVLLAVAGYLGASEFTGLARKTGVRPFEATIRVIALLLPLVVAWALVSFRVRDAIAGWWMFAAIGVVLWLLGLAVFTRTPEDRPLGATAVTLLAVAYTACPLLATFYIRHARWSPRSWAGVAAVFFPFVVVWVCDSAAMFGGRIFGGPKLAPHVSPGKTWSGGIAGVVGGGVIAACYAWLVFPRAGIAIGVVTAAVIGLVLSVVGQIGDLAESLLKREAGVKDSSTLIPGHGGVLDRLDSLYFVLPVTAAAYHLLGLF